jgi:hypothetical protein
MFERVLRYVRHERAEAYRDAGWTEDNWLEGTHHGVYATVFEWKREGEPVEPQDGDPVEDAA